MALIFLIAFNSLTR